MIAVDEREKQPVVVQEARFGWTSHFTNVIDGKKYFQRTMSVRSLIAPPPKLILKDGIVERLNFHVRHLYFKPLIISCETRTFSVTKRDNKHLIMSCFGSVYSLEMRKIAKELPRNALRQVAQDMAAIFRNAEIHRMTAGSGTDEFEGYDWHVVYYSRRRLLSWGSTRKQPVAFVKAGADKLGLLDLFREADISASEDADT